jgi:arylsulfatase A-like enzyme
MSARKLWLGSVLTHAGFWLVSFGLSMLFLYQTDDAWYVMARRHFFGPFSLIQLSILPWYVLLATLVFAWAWPLMELWNRRRPAARPWRRFIMLLGWFWLTVFSVSIFSSFGSWFIAFSFLHDKAGIDITYAGVAYLYWPVWLNAAVFALVSAAGIGWGLYRIRGRWLYGGIGLAAASGLAWAAWPSGGPVEENGKPNPGAPNLVIIGSDSMRADHLSCYGYSRETSPTIDAIATQGALLERMYVVAPSTTESILAMLSGQPPRKTGVRSIFPSREMLEQSKKFPQLAPVLRQAGYRTVATGDWAASDFEHIMQGFDVRDVEPAMRFQDYIDGAARRCHPFILSFFTTPVTRWAAPGMTSMLQSSRTHESILARAEGEIERAARTKQPLFLFAFLSTTHLPYAVPEGEPVVFGDPNYQGRHHRQVEYTLTELVHSDLAGELAKERQRVEDLYDSCIRAFDGQVARVARALEKRGLSENTLFIVLSDHGDDHWEPGTNLGRTVHAGDQSIRIPMVWRWPARLKPRRVRQLLRETDVAATIAELFGLPWPDRSVSFRKHLDGEAVEDDREAFVEAGVSWAGEVTFPPQGEHLGYPGITDLVVPDLTWEGRLVIGGETLARVMKAKDRALIRGARKLVYRPLKSGPQIRMYDLLRDAHGQSPLPPDPEMVKRLREILAEDPEEFYLAWPREIFEAPAK